MFSPLRNEMEKVAQLEAEVERLRSILGRYACGVGACEGVLFESYGNLKKDEQALVRTLADIWEKADDAI